MALSYIELVVTPEEADTFAEARGWTDWTGETAVKTAAIRRGQDFIATSYNARWTEEWTMADAPEEVKQAVIIAARQELVQPGSLSPVVTAGPQKVLTEVKGIKWEVVDNGSGRLVPLIPSINGLLAGIVKPSRGSTYTASLLRA